MFLSIERRNGLNESGIWGTRGYKKRPDLSLRSGQLSEESSPNHHGKRADESGEGGDHHHTDATEVVSLPPQKPMLRRIAIEFAVLQTSQLPINPDYQRQEGDTCNCEKADQHHIAYQVVDIHLVPPLFSDPHGF